MIPLAFILGLLLPALNGWMLLSLLQWKKRVLFVSEQWVLGLAVGLLFTMLLTFIAHAFIGLALDRVLFFGIQLGLLLILGLLYFRFTRHMQHPTIVDDSPAPLWIRILLWVLVLFVVIKVLIAGTLFLLLTPTMLDDTLDNWNLRAKVFYFDEALTLAMPSEDPLTSPMGISSYSPSLPLMKTWLAHAAGQWSDPLINAIHAVWYLSALSLLYFAMRKIGGKWWGFFGVYMLGSMPLYLMHGSNTYADAFMSVYVFSAASMLFFALRESDVTSRLSYFRIAAFCAGLLPFTKNEGVLVYLPPLLVVLCFGLLLRSWSKKSTLRECVTVIGSYILSIALMGLPWIAFKWMNGLTFGNAKAVGSLGIGWQDQAGISILVNTFFEGNWLFLFPLLIILILWRYKSAATIYVPIIAYILMIIAGQMFIFLFTSLSIEAILQTGLARGFVQLMPLLAFAATLLIYDARRELGAGFSEIRRIVYAGKQ